jgi:hypothetical protein
MDRLLRLLRVKSSSQHLEEVNEAVCEMENQVAELLELKVPARLSLLDETRARFIGSDERYELARAHGSEAAAARFHTPDPKSVRTAAEEEQPLSGKR